jgi:hypothetical protein
MKTIQTNSYTLTQIAMLTNTHVFWKKALMGMMFIFLLSPFVLAQFIPPIPSVPGVQTAEEVRVTSSVSYDLNNASHNAGEEYRWAVLGGTIDDILAVTVGDTSILEWTVDAHTITVDWLTVIGSPIGSAPGEIIVQKKTPGSSCYSEFQILDISMWNSATADLDPSGLATVMCSGDGLGGNLPVNLTGAPDPSAAGFVVTYNISALGLTDLGGASLDVVGATVTSNTELANIALPDGLLNTSGATATYTLTMTEMHDDFDGLGTLGATTEYIITVHPTPVTGEINSGFSLVRR